MPLTDKELAAEAVKSADTLKASITVDSVRIRRLEYEPATELTAVYLDYGYDPGTGFVVKFNETLHLGKEEFSPDLTGLAAALKARNITV